ncbi:MAG: DNA alkylation repair protein [Prosthecobacter sp.]
MSSKISSNPQLKDWFDEQRYRSLAKLLRSIEPRFDSKSFLQLVLEGLEERTLMQRLHQCAAATNATLSGSYRSKIAVLQKLAPHIDHDFVSIFLCDFTASFGLEDFDFSMEALRFFTRFGSAEFAVRPFIMADQKRALATMHRWTSDSDEKVRRLSSEGSRPRLPWSMRLPSLIQNPEPTAAILEALKNDVSLFVRRSVANHLNDITKDHPELVMARLETWDLQSESIRWISRHACRTLIKCGHPRALKLFGFGQKAAVEAQLTVSPVRLSLGQHLQITTEIHSTSNKPQQLVIDYVIHYVKTRGSTFAKVFKWTEMVLPARGRILLTKSQLIRDFSTRKHHPGHHVIDLQINGSRVATVGFDLN